MKIALSAFNGMIPKLNARDIPPGHAVDTQDARFENGTLVPVNGSATSHTFALGVNSIFLHDGVWRGFTGVVDTAQGPVATDRLYYTGDGAPKMLVAGDGTYPLALPAPTTKLILVANGAVQMESDGVTPNPPLETIGYTYTYVTLYGEESAPAPLSDLLDWQQGQTVTMTGFDIPDPGRGISYFRIYRAQTSITGVTDLYFVKELGSATASFTHDVDVDPPAEFITTRDFDTPPDDLKGIVTMPNGIMAAHTGRSLRFCEPYQPHAWPLKYEMTTDYEIVGLAVFGMTLCVLTEGTPYMVQGQTPDSMAMQQMEVNLPCVSARSIVDLGYAAAYASPRGLVVMSNSGPQIVTKSLMTRNQWVAMRPDTIFAAQVDGKYVFTVPEYVDDAMQTVATQTYAVNMENQQATLETFSITPKAYFYELQTGQLHYLEPDGLTVRTFDDPDEAPTLTAEWSSGTLQMDHPVSFGCFKVAAEPIGGSASLTVRVYGDDVLLGTATAPNQIDRLASGAMHDKWRVEIETDMKVERVIIAGSPSEIVQ